MAFLQLPLLPNDFLSFEERCQREAELTLNNPHISPLEIYYVSQLPLNRQEEELQRVAEETRRRDEERRVREAREAAINRQIQESLRRQMFHLEQLQRLLQNRPTVVAPSGNAVLARSGQRQTITLNSRPFPRFAFNSNSNNPGSSSNRGSGGSLCRTRTVPVPTRRFTFCSTSRRGGDVVHAHRISHPAVSAPNGGATNSKDNNGQQNENDGDKIKKYPTQQCPFCSKTLSVRRITYHVHYSCKAAAGQLNPRQDWQCLRK